MIKKTRFFFALISALSLSACSTTGQQPVNTMDLSELQNMTAADLPEDKLYNSNNIRMTAIKDTALSLGAQAGLAARSKVIDQRLLAQANNLSSSFNFSALVLNNSVLPPVLVQSDESISIDGTDALRISDHTYKIEQQAEFVTSPPTWRNYLWMSYDKPEPPNALLLPKNSTERDLWQREIAKGWDDGIGQANTIYAQNLAKLRRDFTGMLLYRQLLDEKMISRPYVATDAQGVTGDGSQMSINDRVLRISAKPQLQTNSSEWKPIIIKEPTDSTS